MSSETPRRPRIHVGEVAPRDGLQNEARFVATGDKVDLIDALSATGVAKIEVTSFVSPTAIPSLRDAADVMAAIRRAPGVTYVALVPGSARWCRSTAKSRRASART